jgi:outer membrane biosynthesis protein TonB
MKRVLLTAATGAVLFVACASQPKFQDMRTPSGEFCSDMIVYPAGQAPEVEYHRLEPIHSEYTARTEAERLESLRKAACKVGADAVIEAANEEVRPKDASTFVTVASGTAITWIRHTDTQAKPIELRDGRPLTTKKTEPEPEATAEPPKAEPEPAPAAKTAPPPASATSKQPEPAPVASATPPPASSGSTTTTTTKTTTTTTTKKKK